MRAQETAPPVMVAYVALGLVWVWVIARFGVEWSKNVEHEWRRIREATLLVETMCSVDKHNLAREFAKCEEAHVMIADGRRMAWLRSFERTLRVVAMQTVGQVGALSLATIANALAVVCAAGVLAVTCAYVTKQIEAANEDPMMRLSPLARARFEQSRGGATVFLDMKKDA